MVHVNRFRLLLIPLLVLGGLLGAATPAAAAGPDCPVGYAEFVAYAGPLVNLQPTGAKLGFHCSSGPVDQDSDWGNAGGDFQGSDDNNMESFKVYGVSGFDACITVWLNTGFIGDWTGRAMSDYGPHVGGIGIDNTTSASRFKKVAHGACTYP